MSQIGLFPEGPERGAIIGGKYRLQKKLSEGGGGIVWKVKNPEGQEIALKFLKWSPLKSRKKAAERFKNEFAILKSLSHPNISKIFDFGLDPDTDQYFFTSELFTEGDLKTLINAPIPDLEELLLQALRALEYLNNHNLLHLDIKPQNLLLRQTDKKPVLALIDFGLATFRQPDRPAGTPNYIPPELIAKAIGSNGLTLPLPGHRSDLYSLGVTFYFILTGTQPFRILTESGKKIDTPATLKRHLTYVPPPPSSLRPEIPAYLDRIIMKLMSKQPDDRYPSAIIAAQALQYSSPRSYPPESKQTLLAYLPREGKLIGRHKEREIIEGLLNEIANGNTKSIPIVCIAGGNGVGRSRLLKSAKPIAQQLEMSVSLFDQDNDLTIDEIQNITESNLRMSPKGHAILIDDLDRIFDLENDDNEFSINDEAMSIQLSINTLIRKLRFQMKLPQSSDTKQLLLFAVNTDRMDLDDVFSQLDLDKSICTILKLKNFNESEMGEYLAAVLGETPSSTVVEQLVQCTDGNPLFITEHLENMIAEGRLFSIAGRPDAKTLKTIGVDFSETAPSRSLAQSFLERFGDLPKEAQETALTLACWHRPASSDELRTLILNRSIGKDLLLLVESGIIKRNKGDSRFKFSNIHAPQIIEMHVDKTQIQKIHDAIAAYLTNSKGASNDEIAYHIAYGTPNPKTVDALESLADSAIKRHHLTEAIHHLQALLGNLPKDRWVEKASTLFRIGYADERMQRFDEAKSIYGKIQKLKAPDELKKKFKLMSAEHIGRVEIRRRNLRKAKHIFSDALKLVSNSKPMTIWRLRFENFLAGIDLRDGRTEDALQRFERTDAVAKKVLSKEDQLLITNNELGETILRAGQVKRALKILKQELKNAEEANDAQRMADRHYLVGNALRDDTIRKYEDAHKHYMLGLEIAKIHHLLNLQIRLQNGLGNLYLKTNDPKKAMEHYREGFRLSQQVDSYTTSVELMIGMGLAAQRLTNPDQTIECFEAALDFSGGPKGSAAGLIRRYRPTIYISLGDAYYQKHDLQHAMEYLDKARTLDDKGALTPDLRYSLYGTLVETYLEYQDYDAAKEYIPKLKAIAKSFPQAQEHLNQLLKRF